MSGLVGVTGNTFFLLEIKEAGKKENDRLSRNKCRIENGGNSLTKKLTEKLRKMGKDVQFIMFFLFVRSLLNTYLMM